MFILSVYKQPSTIKHFKICQTTIEEDGEQKKVYTLQNKDKEFDNLSAMLTHYEKNMIHTAPATIGRCISENEYREAKAKAKADTTTDLSTKHECPKCGHQEM